MEKYHNNISLAIKSALKFNKQECINNNDKDLDMSCDFKCWPAPFGIIGTVCTAIILSLITIITIGGNFLVLIAFGVKQKLRESKNFFIVSLAFTDLLIGMISLPLFSVYILVGFWPPQLGPILCDLWLSIDHTVCLVSQLTVLSITIDRFCSVRFPAHYQIIKDRNKTILIIIGTWAISALIFFIPIFGWEHFIDKRDLLPW
nr:muscarinic acetylcholine receptor gar-2-like [Lepeophtheirus salmonis]